MASVPYAAGVPPPPTSAEKQHEVPPTPPAAPHILDSFAGLLDPVSAPLAATFEQFHNWKEYIGLGQPGTIENLTRDVQNTQTTHVFFEGARADLSKVVSPISPAFQISHSFTLGQQQSSYKLGALYASQKSFLHGQWDPSAGGVNMRANHTWNASDVTKVQGQLSSAPGQTMFQIEHDHLGPHYSLNLKTINPSPLDGTGIHFVSLLHSFTSRLSLGFETIIQKTSPTEIIPATSYLLKYTSAPQPKPTTADTMPLSAPQPAGVPFVPSWTATAQLQPTGNIQTTYFQRLSDKVDVALDFQTQIQPASFMGPAKRDALTTLAAKYEFRMATFRGQIDSAGKVGMFLEQRFTPAFAFLVGGEIDHAKNSSRFGVGVMIESTTMTPEEMQAAGMLAPQ